MIRRIVLAALVAAFLPLGVSNAAAAAPERLIIPSLGVNARIIPVAKSDDDLLIGHELQGAVYTWNRGDPPCDATGSTVYFGHTYRAGHGVADGWGSLKKGDIVRVAGCRFKVGKREFWKAERPMGDLFAVGGPARVVLVGCKADDYSKRTVVFLRKAKAPKVKTNWRATKAPKSKVDWRVRAPSSS